MISGKKETSTSDTDLADGRIDLLENALLASGSWLRENRRLVRPGRTRDPKIAFESVNQIRVTVLVFGSVCGSACVFVLVFTLGNDGLVEFVADRFGKGINVVIAVDFDGLAGCVADDEAVVAPLKMLLQLRLELDVDTAVEVFVQFFKKVFALHCGCAPSLLLFLK